MPSYLDSSISRFLDDLASDLPAPGGGSAASLVGALAAALASMVCHFTIGKEKYKDFEAEAKEILSQSEAIRAQLSQLIDGDVTAYGKLSAAYKMPRNNDEQKSARSSAIQEALRAATQVPLKIVQLSFEMLKLNLPLSKSGNENLISDVGVSVMLAEAAFYSALFNVKVNLASIKDRAFRQDIERQIAPLLESIGKLREDIIKEVEKRLSGDKK